MRALVIGGTGTLGTLTVGELERRGVPVGVLSRKRSPLIVADWRAGDLVTGEGLADAFHGVDVVIYAANVPPGELARAMANLLAAARETRVPHLVYVSIAGIDLVAWFPYYRAKLDDERAVQQSRVPHTIVRAAQFFELIEQVLHRCRRKGRIVVPAVTLQPVAAAAVARRLAGLVTSPPVDRGADVIGPERRTLASLAREWNPLAAVTTEPPDGELFRAFAALTLPARTGEGPTWGEWLRERAV